MERGLTHVVHSLGLGIIAYVILVYVVKDAPKKAEDRSVLIGGLALLYMVIFGHKLPGKVNNNLF